MKNLCNQKVRQPPCSEGLADSLVVKAGQRQSVVRLGRTGRLVAVRRRTTSVPKMCSDGLIRPIPRPRTKKEAEERFWELADVRSENECWPWLGKRHDNQSGLFYGVFWNGFKGVKAHRFIYELKNGSLPAFPKALVCHTCDNSLCVNPGHLYKGSYKTNNSDSLVRGRRQTKLDPNKVRAIRARFKEGESLESIATTYKVTAWNIKYVVEGVTWKHVT